MKFFQLTTIVKNICQIVYLINKKEFLGIFTQIYFSPIPKFKTC